MHLAGNIKPSNASLSVDCPNTTSDTKEETGVFQGKTVLSFVDPKKNPSTSSSLQLMTATALAENVREQKNLSKDK